MRRLLAVVVAGALFSSPLLAAGAKGTLAGTARSAAGQALSNYIVQLRTLSTGKLVGSTTSSAVGDYKFTGLDAGKYAVEVLNPAGSIVGTSAATVSSGISTTGVAVAASTGAAATIAGLTAGAAGAGIGTAAIGTVTGVAAAAGVAGIAAVRPKPSASK